MAIAAVLIVGCSKNEATPTDTPKDTTSQPPSETTTLATFKNDKGEIICPVTGDVITSEDKASGHADHDGKRYFFCCGSCDAPFKKDPAKYADGANLKNTKPGTPAPEHTHGDN